ncbi:MAG TPA: DNA-directed RNA polymerase subunit beta' [Bacilli bacterium]|nr:DNA-directed RNA polymerase subunit beta' [Bacilli bacterium]
MFDINRISKIKVGLASPEAIRSWSYGEVLKPETINYRSQKPEMQGLFCEKIFGPSKDYECHCGKYKKQRYAGVVCEKCGVEVMTKDARRERMGHIELATPCAHIWYVKGIPSRIALVLDINAKQLEEIVYLAGSTLICLNPGSSKILKYRQVIDEKTGRIDFVAVIKEFIEQLEGTYDGARAQEYIEKLENRFEPINFEVITGFIAKHTGAEFGEGAEAIKRLLREVDLDREAEAIDKELKECTTQRRTKLTKRLEIVESFRQSGNRPEWMVLDVLPVIPPDLRPMLQLDGGRFATSDLNDLYRRLIARNRRLKNLINIKAPTTMLRNEKRMLQEAVDALIDNGRRGKPVLSSGGSGRELKSLSSALKGKQGRFRQNLLGKRVDYSGRSVIAVGPDLKMYECGLPREMAIQLLRPFIAGLLIERGFATSHKQADKKVDNYDEVVFDILEEIISKHPVLLNRAPTLHRLGIQAFQPKLVEGRAIRLHPLVCTGFNADFDGDQMAVHVPLSKAAQEEALNLMLASNNILGPKDGLPIATPSQDMVIGNFYLTMEQTKADFLRKAANSRALGDNTQAEQYELFATCEGKVFRSFEEVNLAFSTKQIHLHNRIALPGYALRKDGFSDEMNEGYLLTSVGKVFFNQIFPSDFPYLNNKNSINLKMDLEEYFVPKGTNIPEVFAKKHVLTPYGSKDLAEIIKEVFHRYGTSKTSAILDKMKDQGFRFATQSGLTVALSDILVLENKKNLIKAGDDRVALIQDQYEQGLLTDEERYQQVVTVWKDDVQAQIKNAVVTMMQNSNDNPLNIIFNSGARGKASNFQQLIGYRGLMSKPSGRFIELPIRSSFREGLSIAEFFIATHGARKVGADTALKTADSGYLTRKLVDVAQDVIIREEDCHTDRGTNVFTIMDSSRQAVITPLYNRLVGRYTLKAVVHPQTGEIIVEADHLMDELDARAIVDAGVTDVMIRSVFGCESKDGICQKCYGRNLATGKLVEVGEAVGIIAAQSIGEPGTQLTMRTFHEGGVAGRNITDGLPRVQEIFEARTPKGEAVISGISGKVVSIDENGGRFTVRVVNEDNGDTRDYATNFGARLRVQVGDEVNPGQKISEGAIYPKDLLKYADVNAVQKYIIKEVQKVYQGNGANIADKHIEVIVRQMLRKLVVIDGGDTDLIPGTRVDINVFTEKNALALAEGKTPAVGVPRLLGIAKSALETESFLSAASFQETTRVLTDAAIKGKTDVLHGLKENVITGKMIPAGRGLKTDEQRAELTSDFSVEEFMRNIRNNYRESHEQWMDQFDDNLSLDE